MLVRHALHIPSFGLLLIPNPRACRHPQVVLVARKEPAPARQLLAAAHVTLDWPSVACGLMDTISMDADEAEQDGEKEDEADEEEEEEEEEEAAERANGRRLYDEQPGQSHPVSEKQLSKKTMVRQMAAIQADIIRPTSAMLRFIGLTFGTRASCALCSGLSLHARARGSLDAQAERQRGRACSIRRRTAG
jgi:hypothetical protein